MSRKFHSTISGKKRLASLTMAALWSCQILAAVPGWAAPTVGVVTSGTAAISQTGNTTTINQSTQAAAINWQGFSIGANETVNFDQPDASSVTLNRVVGSEQSVINGALNANGQVFLVNSNGILFGKGASVNTGGFVASTLGISDEDFNSGKYIFKRGSTSGSVINMGTITAKDGGYVGLLGNSVSNQGVITATKGTVALASGSAITLNFNGDSMVSVTVDEGVLKALVENKQAIYADGGTVILTAKAAEDLLSAQVNNSGIIQARTIDDLKGDITLYAHGGTANVDGTLDASAPTSGDGGFIETSGDKVHVADSAVVTTKSAAGESGGWLIDPTDFTISAGSAAQTESGIGVTTLLNNLASTPITITTAASGTGNGDININAALGSYSVNALPNSLTLTAAGDININAPIYWSASTLTLNATNNIYVNAVMTANGSANLVATYGAGTNVDGTPMGLYTYRLAGATSSFVGKINFSGIGGVTLNGKSYTVINALQTTYNEDLTVAIYGLDWVLNHPDGNYVLGSNPSNAVMSGTPSTNPVNLAGAIGSSSTPFTGTFNGLGHQINVTTAGTGLFDVIGAAGIVTNLGVSGGTYASSSNPTAVGRLANVNRGSIINTYAVGVLYARDAYAKDATVQYLGELVGVNYGLVAQSSTGYLDLKVTNVGGGLIGLNEDVGRIIDCDAWFTWSDRPITEATGGNAVTTVSYVGGLVGVNKGKILRSSVPSFYALLSSTSSSSLAAGTYAVGGLVGQNTGTIEQGYVANQTGGYVSSGPYLAGFVGDNSGTITNSYTTALDAGTTSNWLAGFAGRNSGTIKTSYAFIKANSASLYGFIAESASDAVSENNYYLVTGGGGSSTVQGCDGATRFTDTFAADGVTVLTTAAQNAALFSNYSGFDSSSIWGTSASGRPILKNLIVYVSGSAAYGTATSTISKLTWTGLQQGDSYKIFTVLSGYLPADGYIDAGYYSPESLFLPSSYTNIKGVAVISPKTLSVVSGLVKGKVYDGTLAAEIDTAVATNATSGLSGLVGAQTLNVQYLTAVFSSANISTGRPVKLTYAVSDGTGKSSNYSIETSTSAPITAKPLSVSATGIDKTYDGTTVAGVNLQLVGVVASDIPYLSVKSTYSAAFLNASVAEDKTVNVSGLALAAIPSPTITASAMLKNYTLNGVTTATTKANINPIVLALYGIKSDDGSATIDAANIGASNILAGEKVTFGGSATIAGTTAGTQPFADLSGLTIDNSNYTLAGSGGNVAVGNAGRMLDKVVSGTADIITVDKYTTITTSDKAIIDWLRFGVGVGETLEFKQPSSSSIVLNRVTSSSSSVIDGALKANGRVFIINSNGVLFGAGSSVNVGALVASTLDITDSDFTSGNYVFTAAGDTGSVISEGDIVIVDGGFLALASSKGVTFSGTGKASGGKALVASAKQLTLTLNTVDSGLSNYALQGLSGATAFSGSLDVSSGSGNGGLIEIAGESITPAAGGIDLSSLNTGLNGTLSWSLPTITIGAGGTFTGDYVTANLATRSMAFNAMDGDLTLNAAITWAADTTLTLAASNDVNINKTINVNGANGGLALNYGHDYSLLTKASFSGTVLDENGHPVAKQAPAGTEYASINPNGTNASLKINGNKYTLIRSLSELDLLDGIDAVTGCYYNSVTGLYDIPAYYTVVVTTSGSTITTYYNPATKAYDLKAPVPVIGYYALAGDLDASGTTYTSSLIANLSGTLTGLGHTVGNLKMNSATRFGVGLVGQTDAAGTNVIRDIGVVNVDITGIRGVGALLGYSNGVTINGAYSTGNISGEGAIGGLLGEFTTATISNSYSDVDILGKNGGIGGLAGFGSTITIANCHAMGDITNGSDGEGTINGTTKVYIELTASQTGGLLGGAYYANVTNSYATGNITAVGGQYVGGLIGVLLGSWELPEGFTNGVSNSFATGNIIAGTAAGGLIGSIGHLLLSTNTNPMTVDNCYATGNVTGTYESAWGLGGKIGGLIGEAIGTDISDCYATGDVNTVANNKSDFMGGLVGYQNYGTIDGCYATGTVTGNGGTGTGGLGYNTSNATNSYYTDVKTEAAAAYAAYKAEVVTGTGRISGGTVGQSQQESAENRPKKTAEESVSGGDLARREALGSFDDHIVYADSAIYGADIKSISADGVEYNLQDASGQSGDKDDVKKKKK